MMPQKTQKDAEETKAKFFGVFPRLLRPKLRQKPYEYFRDLLPSFPKHDRTHAQETGKRSSNL
jgi:hypothetical protein